MMHIIEPRKATAINSTASSESFHILFEALKLRKAAAIGTLLKNIVGHILLSITNMMTVATQAASGLPTNSADTSTPNMDSIWAWNANIAMTANAVANAV